MFKYTTNTLKKIEDLFKAVGYVVRYEKGNFHAGYCVLENKKVAVVNKYFTTEARINCLIDIMSKMEVDASELEETELALYKKITSQNVEN